MEKIPDENSPNFHLNDKDLEDADLFYRSLFEHGPDMVFFLDTSGIIVKMNKVFAEGLGYKKDEIMLSSMKRFLPSSEINLQREFYDKAISGEIQNVDTALLHKNGDIIQINLTIIPAKSDHNVIGIFGIAKDITELKKVEDLNRYLANYDSLTDLPNRRLFQEKLEQEILSSQILQQKCAVMYLDLDRFKYINDSLGHSMGDKLLIQISRRLKEYLGNHNVVARFGGDEFAVLLPNIYPGQIEEYSKMIIKSLGEPFFIEDYKLFITTSIGISQYPNDGEDSETLMKNADSALYKAKEKGNNTYQIYTSSINIENYKIFTLESDLRKALELNQLELYYQPKICASTNQIIGAEALIRWDHPDWGIVSPDEFISLAEETGQIVKMGKWIKYTACTQNKAWQDAGLPAIPVSINLSAFRFLEKDLLNNIIEVLKTTKLAPEYLEIEILETSLLENEKVVFSILDELKKIGIQTTLDDFGTGYSSLSYLKGFKGRIDTLKIDRTFISDLNRTDPDDSNYITKTIIQLAQHLKMEVVAEGVETVEQLEILKEYKCNIIQGYLFSKPVPADEFATLLTKGKIEIPETNTDETVVHENRRKLFRISPDYPLLASMTLTRIHGRSVELGKTEVLVEDIGLGGLRFLSNLRFTVHQDIILEFETEILGNMIKMYGSVVWMNEVKSGIYQYGLEFSMDESERSPLTQLLNKLAILLRKNPLVPDCSFVTMDRFNFFRMKETN